MLRALGFLVLIFLIVHLFTTPQAGHPPVLSVAIPASSGYFEASGTIDYTPNSTGQLVPYLVYKLQNGTVATKALTFAESGECLTSRGSYPCPLISSALRVYYGVGPVYVQGTIDAEHVVVSRMSLV